MDYRSQSFTFLILILILQFCIQQPTIPVVAISLNGAQLDVRDYLQATDQDIILHNGTWTLQKLVDNYPDIFEVINMQNISGRISNNSAMPVNNVNAENINNVTLLMSRPIVVDKQASLKISDAQLLLESFPSNEAFPPRILVLGNATIENSTIDSFRRDQSMADRNPFHPRPFIAAVDGGIVDIIKNTTIKHLGFALGGISSLAAVNYYRTENFKIMNSTFDYDYIGFYSDNSSNFEIKGNTFTGNTLYGIDPHTASKNFLIDSNHVSLSGGEGIICSFLCDNVTITNNLVDEGTEGIGLHWLTNSSKIQKNIVINNEQFGVFIRNSSNNNVIEGNILVNNGCNIGLFEYANGNTIVDNIIVDSFRSQRYCDNEYVYPDSSSGSNNIGRNILITENNSSSYDTRIQPIKNDNPQNISFVKYNKSMPYENKSAMLNATLEYPLYWQNASEYNNNNNTIAQFSVPSSDSNASMESSSKFGAGNDTAIFAIEANQYTNQCGQRGIADACLDLSVHANVEKVIEEDPSLEVIQSEPMSISEMPAHRIVFLQTNGTEDSNKIQEIYAVDEPSKIEYTIRFEADSHTYERNSAVLDKVIESISLYPTRFQ